MQFKDSTKKRKRTDELNIDLADLCKVQRQRTKAYKWTPKIGQCQVIKKLVGQGTGLLWTVET